MASNVSPQTIDILKDLYDATDGDNWAQPWIFSEDCAPCQTFRGVWCSSYTNSEGYLEVTELVLTSFPLIGTIPESFYGLRNLTSMVFNYNYLHGTLSEKMGQLSQLYNIDLNDNMLSGTLPASMSSISTLKSIDLSTNSFDGKLDHAFNPSKQPLLSEVVLDYNKFTGTIPHSLASLPGLTDLSLQWNCLHGSIPDSLCEAQQLTSLYLTAMNTGPSCQKPLVTFQGFSSYTPIHKVTGSIPDCLMALPSIAEVYLDGLGLTCPLPTTYSSSLWKLSASNNALHGPIPNALQEVEMDTLQLSYNRLSGTLEENSVPCPYSLLLTYNRITGYVPDRINDASRLYGSMQILEGNAFNCYSHRKGLPVGDKYYDKYQDCGSNSFNTTLYESLGVTGGSAILIVLALVACKHVGPLRKVVSTLGKFRTNYREQMYSTAYYQWDQFVRYWVCSLTIICLVLLVPMYVALSAYYSTQTYKYAWIVSGVYLNGVTATVCMLVVLLLLGFSVYWPMRRSEVSFAIEKSAYSMSECWSVAKIAWMFVVLLLVVADILLVVVVNTSYIAVARLADEATIQKASVAMSVFKIVWNFFIVRNVLKVLTFKSPIKDFRIQQHWFTNLETSLVLFNNILAPYIATLFASADCIQDAFVRNSDFAFIYSYQCSSTFITTYASVFLFMFALTAVGFPVIQCSIMALHIMVYPSKDGNMFYFSMEKMFSLVQPKLLFPEIVLDTLTEPNNRAGNAVHEPVVSDADVGSWKRVLSKRLFCADLMVVDMVSMFAIMLTFGAVVPAVAVLGCCAVLSQSVFNELMIGRGIRKVKSMYGGGADAAEKISKFREELLLECRAFGDLFKLNMFICVPFVVVFYGLLVFDMLGDTEGSDRAIWAPVAVLCIVVGLTVAARRFGSREAKELRKSYEPLLAVDGKVDTFRDSIENTVELEANPML